MIKKYYASIDETLFSETLSNGLRVYYLPKNGYHKIFGIFSTNFGSLDTTFEGRTYPAGIAHFLEHKLFEKEEGDVMLKFGKLGAQTNAFTSFDRTAYLFESTENAEKNIELLLDFVQTPYFTAASVQKEQGIIRQEIQMYQDDPDWRLYAATLAALYPETPLAEDIAGTSESISEISPEMLYKNYEHFYQPSNMTLFLAGHFELNEISELVTENQLRKTFPERKKIKRQPLKSAAVIPHVELSMEVAESKLALGVKGNHELKAAELLEYRLALQLFFEMIFGKMSDFYESSYRAGLLDDSFGYELECDLEFQTLILSLDTPEPEKLSNILQERLKCYRMKEKILEPQFELVRRKMLAVYFSSLNSLEAVANEFTRPVENSEEIFFDSIEILSQLTLKKVMKISETFLKSAEFTEVILLKEKNK